MVGRLAEMLRRPVRSETGLNLAPSTTSWQASGKNGTEAGTVEYPRRASHTGSVCKPRIAACSILRALNRAGNDETELPLNHSSYSLIGRERVSTIRTCARVVANGRIVHARESGFLRVGDAAKRNPHADRNTSKAAQGDLGKLRIERWKTDNTYKKQALGNVDSIQRNLQGAMPEIIGQLRAAPEDLSLTLQALPQSRCVVRRAGWRGGRCRRIRIEGRHAVTVERSQYV